MVKFATDPFSSPNAWSNVRALDDRRQLAQAVGGGPLSTPELGKDGVASPGEELIQPGLARTAPAIDHQNTETVAALGRVERTKSPAERKAAVNDGADQLTLSSDDHAMVRNSVDYIEGLEQRRALGDLSQESISNLSYALNKSTSGLTKNEGLKADSALKARAERAQGALEQIGDRQRAEKEASLVAKERRQIAELETPASAPRPTDPRFLAASDAITKGRFESVDNSPHALNGFTFLRDPSGQTDFSRVPKTIPAKRNDPAAEKEYPADGSVRFVKSNPARDRHRWTVEGHATSDRIAVISPSGERWTFSRGTSGYEHLRRELYRATQGDPLDPTRIY